MNRIIANLKKQAEHVEESELEQYIISNGDVYNKYTVNIIENLKKKFKKGIYDENLAVKAYRNLVDKCAKEYAKVFSHEGDEKYIFTTKDKDNVAVTLEKHYREQVEK